MNPQHSDRQSAGAPSAQAADTSVGRIVRVARNAQGATLEQVSEKIGVSPATLSLIERDKVSVTRDRLVHIADALGCDVETLGVHLLGDGDGEGQGEGERPRVLDAAIDCFAARGYHGTSMREIAHAGKMSVAGVYHHYASKQQMLFSVLEPAMIELRAMLAATRDAIPADQPDARFAAMIEVLADFHIRRKKIAFLGLSELRSLESPYLEQIVAIRRDNQNMVNDEARAAARQGVFTTPDPTFASRMTVMTAISLSRWYDPTGPVTPAQAIANTVAYATAMMKAPVSEPAEAPGQA